MSDPIPGWIVPEEEIAATLTDGMAMVRQAFRDATIDEFVGRVYANLPALQQAAIKQWLSEHDVAVVHGYPHFEQQLPCWVVVIDPEEQVQQYAGDDGEEIELDTGEHVSLSAERWRSTVGVITYAENADLMRWLYQLSKFFMARARRALADHFPYSQRLAGRDLQPEKIGESGRFRFRRALSVAVEYDQTEATREDVSDLTAVVAPTVDSDRSAYGSAFGA